MNAPAAGTSVMREMGVAEGLIEQALRQSGKGRLKRIDVGIGLLSGVSAESLKSCMSAALHERNISGVELMARNYPIECVCPCGRHYAAMDIRARCPDCKQICEMLIGGRDCHLEAVEKAPA